MRRAARARHDLPRRLEAQAPAVLHEQRGAGRLPPDEQEDADAREARAQEAAIEHAERWKDAADEDRFERAIERDAVNRARDVIRPQQRKAREHDPSSRGHQRIDCTSPTCTPTGRISALPAT